MFNQHLGAYLILIDNKTILFKFCLVLLILSGNFTNQKNPSPGIIPARAQKILCLLGIGKEASGEAPPLLFAFIGLNLGTRKKLFELALSICLLSHWFWFERTKAISFLSKGKNNKQ